MKQKRLEIVLKTRKLSLESCAIYLYLDFYEIILIVDHLKVV